MLLWFGTFILKQNKLKTFCHDKIKMTDLNVLAISHHCYVV